MILNILRTRVYHQRVFRLLSYWIRNDMFFSTTATVTQNSPFFLLHAYDGSHVNAIASMQPPRAWHRLQDNKMPLHVRPIKTTLREHFFQCSCVAAELPVRYVFSFHALKCYYYPHCYYYYIQMPNPWATLPTINRIIPEVAYTASRSRYHTPPNYLWTARK